MYSCSDFCFSVLVVGSEKGAGRQAYEAAVSVLMTTNNDGGDEVLACQTQLMIHQNDMTGRDQGELSTW